MVPQQDDVVAIILLVHAQCNFLVKCRVDLQQMVQAPNLGNLVGCRPPV